MPAIDEAIQKTISAVENIAPKAWAATIEAQRLDAEFILATRALWALVTILSTVVAVRVLRKWEPDHYDGGLKTFLRILVSIACTLILGGLACDVLGATLVLLHPGTYAARALMGR